jgi:hypothetical protein
VVGTPGSLDADPVFDNASNQNSSPPFDVLILDHAEELTETDFLHLSKLAERWVLIGDVSHTETSRPTTNGAHRQGPGRTPRNAGPSFTASLSRILDRETWTFETDRLVCRLAHLTPDQRRTLTREPLVDSPEVELRFASQGDEPIVAEVAFPLSMGAAAAKAFLFAQLGEILLRPCGEPVWDHTQNAITVAWPITEQLAVESTWIELEPGVRERVTCGGATAFTAAVSFDASAGWDTERATSWLREHTRVESASRFASVPRTGRAPH